MYMGGCINTIYILFTNCEDLINIKILISKHIRFFNNLSANLFELEIHKFKI